MDSEKLAEKILNKKFKKTVFSGYETLDVDAFFDEMIEYFKIAQNDLIEYRNLAINEKQKVAELEKQLMKIKQENQTLSSLIRKYEENGYSNVHINDVIQNLQNKINEKNKN